MRSLGAFTEFAERVGVPHVPQPSEAWGTARGTEKCKQKQLLNIPVPLVPLVPLENNDGWDESDWHAAFDERAGFLEFDAGMSRADAEAVARTEISNLRLARSSR